MPPITNEPTSEFISTVRVVWCAGPLQTGVIDVVGTEVADSRSVDTNRLPGSVEVNICNDRGPWEGVSEIELEWVGCCCCFDGAEGFGFVQECADGVV